MSITLYHHPHSRAATVIWMLEEVGQPYELHHVELRRGEQKEPGLLRLNPMGKLPVLVDGDAVVTEVAAIGMWLADRYAPGRLAPALDDPARATYLRWILFAPSVIEPAAMAKGAGWEVRAAQAGFGTFDSMQDSLSAAIGDGPWVLGEHFSMADVVLGATVRWFLRFGMLDARPEYSAYVERLNARPACQIADARNAEIAASLG
ncbi:MAG: glutathione S-transferase family protein [Myxococcales bacterium]|nr:glutathione S-transferase family protein [Myxococcales bacterium]